MFWHLEQAGDRVALVTEDGREVSYAELAVLADASGFGAHPRGLALLAMDNSLGAIAAYLGALRAGHPLILTNGGSPGTFRSLAERYRPELSWSAGTLAVAADGAGAPLHPDLAVMLSTSGSTGSAKLVRLSVGAVEANARSIAEYLGITPDARAITTLPPAYSYGLSVINSHLAAGASLILTDLSVAERRFAELAVRHGATSMAGVPYTYELLEASGLLDQLPPTLTTLTQAGGRLAPERVERVRIAAERQGVRFFVMYGQTEATARMAFVPPEQLATHADCIGRPIPGGRFELVDPDTGAPAEFAGELSYRGPNVMMGYAEARDELARGAEIDALVTGDLAELAAPGLYRITGRKSRFLKILGLRIALDEVEAQAARRGWTVAATGDDSRLVFATDDGRDPAPLADELAGHFKLPASRVAGCSVPVMPRLSSGKVDYPAIRALAPEAAAVASGDGDEQPLAAYTAFLTRLARKPVDDRASFQAIGGDSLNYVEAAVMLERALGEAPPGWETMTLRELALLTPASPAGPGLGTGPSSAMDTHYIQSMRSIAIMLVVISHAVNPVNQMFGIPKDVGSLLSFRHVNSVFIFVAGYLFQYLLTGFRYRQYLQVKFQTVVIPYLVVSAPVLLAMMLGLLPHWNDMSPGLSTPVHKIGYLLATGAHLGPLWFIPMIVMIYMLAPVLKVVDDHPRLYWLLVPLLALSAYVGRSSSNANPFWNLAFFLPVYVIGMACCRYRHRVLPFVRSWWPLLMLAFFAGYTNRYASASWQEVGLVAKTLFSLGLLGMLSRYSGHLPSWFDRIGELSFGVYFLHGYVFLGLGPIRKHLHLVAVNGVEYYAVLLGTAASALLISVIGVLVVKAIFGRYSRQIVGA